MIAFMIYAHPWAMNITNLLNPVKVSEITQKVKNKISVPTSKSLRSFAISDILEDKCIQITEHVLTYPDPSVALTIGYNLEFFILYHL